MAYITINVDYEQAIKKYPLLTQEEIVTLYANEGIVNESNEEIINNLSEQIIKKEQELVAVKSLAFSSQEAMLLGQEIETLKTNLDDLYNLNQEIQRIVSLTDNGIDKTIARLKQEIALRESQLSSLSVSQRQAVAELKQEIADLQLQLESRKQTYKYYAHRFYLASKGIKLKDRIYPSNELRNKIVCSHLYLALYLAKIYYFKYETVMDLDDLLQIANMALISAAHYYIPSEIAKFTTYASVCIENKLKSAIFSKNKKSKRPYKPEEFFQKEADRIEYIKLFIDALKTKSKSGKSYYYSEAKIEKKSVILNRFRESIRSHNELMKLRGETSRLWPSFSGKCTAEKFDEVVRIIISMILDSKLSILFDIEDRNFISLVVNLQNKSGNIHEVSATVLLLEEYAAKLEYMQRFIAAEKALIELNDGITPSEEDILMEVNRQIKFENREKYQLKKSGFYDRYPDSYKKLWNYFAEYYYEFGVVSFADKDDSTSRAAERISIEKEIYDLLDGIYFLIDEIKESSWHKVWLSYDTSDPVAQYNPYKRYEYAYSNDSGKYDEAPGGECFLREEALKLLQDLADDLTSHPESFIEAELKARKTYINAVLKDKNKEIIEYNTALAALRDKYFAGSRYTKKVTLNTISQTSHDVETLYGDDEELIVLLSGANNKGRSKAITLSVEDEVENNIFLKQYYEALQSLPEIERMVLLYYFDENGYHNATAREIAAILNITENRVYKAKSRALKKLSENPVLKSYIE